MNDLYAWQAFLSTDFLEKTHMIIVGIDWAIDKHDVCILSQEGQRLAKFTIAHTTAGLKQLADNIAKHAPEPQNVRVIFELHDGALLAWLDEQQYTLYGINPKASDRARDRYKPAGGKNDELDAFVLADTLRNDRQTLRPLQPQNQQTLQIKELLQLRTHFVQQRTKAIQRIHDRLAQWAPQLNALCADFRSRWHIDILEKFPLQHDLHKAHINTINTFIRKHKLCKKTAEKVRLAHAAAPMHIPDSKTQALRIDMQTQVETIRLLDKKVSEIDKIIHEKVLNHPQAHILASLPVKADNTQASLITGFAGHGQNLPTHQRLSATWGVSAVTVKSGKHCQARFRKAADKLMRQALMQFAFNTAFDETCWASSYYKQKRDNGTPHFGALRALATKWVKIIRKMILTNTPYDEQRHQHNKTQATPGRNAA